MGPRSLRGSELRATLNGHTRTVRAISSDRGKVVSGSDDQSVLVWDKQVTQLLEELKGHDAQASIVRMLSGERVLTAAHDRIVKMWDVRTDTCVATVGQNSSAVLCMEYGDPNGILAAGGRDAVANIWDSGVAWQLTLSRPKHEKETGRDEVEAKDTNTNDGDLCILMFRPLMSSDKAEIEFMKQGSFTLEELDAWASVLQLAGQPKSVELRPRGDAAQIPTIDKTISKLKAMGVKIYGLTQTNEEHIEVKISWDNIAGYDYQKWEIEDTILLALKSPEVYDDIAQGNRCKFETNRPRAVLFEGPPGTGKASCARVIANQAGVPLLQVPLEVIMSKYYGGSERLLEKVISPADEIPNGATIFLDEVDSVATARDGETHEATHRLLSVLLQQIHGFEQDKKVVVVAATNQKQDLDPALLSRVESTITFGLPDHQTRQEIAAQYAKNLTKSELAELASVTEEMSGRDISDVCQQAERLWASKIIQGQVKKKGEEQGHVSLLTKKLVPTQYLDSHKTTSLQPEFSAIPRMKRALPMDYSRVLPQDSKLAPKLPGPLISNSFTSHSVPTAVTSQMSSALEPPLKVTAGSNTDATQWKQEHQTLDQNVQLVQQLGGQMHSQLQHVPPTHIPSDSTMTSHFHQPVNSYSQMHECTINLPSDSAVLSKSMTIATPLQSGHVIVTPEINQAFIQAQFPAFYHSWGQECSKGGGIVTYRQKKEGEINYIKKGRIVFYKILMQVVMNLLELVMQWL